MFAEILLAKLAGICEISDPQIELMQRHFELLSRWNKKLNLIRFQTLEEAVERHYAESVFAACHLPPAVASLGDIGSGAGFPGIPIGIMRPLASIVLIESHQRKAAFLREASRALPNVRVIARRAEDIEDRFDWVVSRAVRYSEIAAALKKLGQRAELLTGEVLASDLIGFEWEEPIRLPWGERRYLWIGHQAVSRFT
ncbi:MAG TPA: 16S rRNA (guanine(527)-N(7))-methyltransferase RsmG [Bryobacteraceae bacterium]|nr:16S rRNA (guanine(527)-N(7))-methyltransferase RsmG [Bryobacteraceae bacterium]